MTLTLNSFSRTLLLLISVSFSSIALFFHLDMALCPFCLCTSFYVLGMSAPFPLLENSGLLEKRLWCPAVQCSLFPRTRWSRSFSYVCCVHPPAVAEMHFHSVHLAAMALFVFFGWGLVPVLCLRPSWTWVGQTACLPPVLLPELQGTLPALSGKVFIGVWYLQSDSMSVLSPSAGVVVTWNYRNYLLVLPSVGFLLCVEPAVTSDICDQPTAGVKLVCVFIFPSTQSRSHFSVVQAPVFCEVS